MKTYMSVEQVQEISKNKSEYLKNKVFEFIKQKIELAAAQGYYAVVVKEDDIAGISHCINRFSQEEIEAAFPGMYIKIHEGHIEGRVISCVWVPAKVEISWNVEE